jgi:hypothetical protein
MKKEEFNLELTVEYDGDNDEHCNAVHEFWLTTKKNLEALRSKNGIGFSHGEIITFPK